ncbi:MAG: DUF4097 family beta strand repeat-containing protein [bacterium]|jgi:DUF4097 and DUF4098 domain-containing protein YvlB|nr:DUF4097 family beta strand repeat-containing protein [bacterium]
MKTNNVLIVAIFFSLIVTGVLVADTHTREFKKVLDFQSNGMIEVKTTNGNIEITSWDKNAVEIRAEIKVKANSRREAEQLLDKVEILIDKNGDRIAIEPDYPRKQGGDGFIDWIFGSGSSVVVNFTIRVPKESDLNLRSTNGRVFVSEVNGELTMKTTNGGIEAEGIQGSATGSTTNGSIALQANQFQNDDSIALHTTNGSIRLTLSSSIKANIKASTVNGSIRTDFPVTVSGRINRKSLSGSINGGGGSIELETVNGSITIDEE